MTHDLKRTPSPLIPIAALAIILWTWLRPSPPPLATPSVIKTNFNGRSSEKSCMSFYEDRLKRKGVVVSIEEFGGVGDGETSNTAAFRRAVERIRECGGGQLNVPAGKWVTGSFNLTSNFTLYLEKDAVILGSQDPKEWPIIEALPSYGRGRERLGGRHISLIHGNGLSNIVITGQNGTIDGRGRMWWELWWNRTLEHTRGHLVELVNSENILIANLTFLNSPFWTIHPVYCRNVVLKNLTVLSPLHSPNTDGIDPDSSSYVCIEDCYIESGDDLVAIKSGWDQYGISTARPSSDIVILRVSGTTPTCSGVGIGSEMSGGVSNIVIEDLHVWDSAAAVRLKTDIGRGGYVTNVTITNVRMENIKIPIRFSQGSNDHPDEGWNPKALPNVRNISISNVVGMHIEKGPILKGIEGAVFGSLHFQNISLNGTQHELKWHCEFVAGEACEVSPSPCPQLKKNVTLSLCNRL